MEFYYGTKLIDAEPEEKDGKEGYKVVYEDGYVSWSPKEAFEKSYRPNGSLSFGHALEAVKSGKWITRSGWNGKNLYVVFADSTTTKSFTQKPYLVLMDFRNTHQTTAVPWVPSIGDCLAEDWAVLEQPVPQT